MKVLRLPAAALALAGLLALGGCVAVPYDGYYVAGYGYPYGYSYGYPYAYGYGYPYGYYPYVSSSLYISGGYGYGCCWGRGGWGRYPYYGRPYHGGHGRGYAGRGAGGWGRYGGRR
ncbi:hypothetical protein [Variovorax soli]|uniref:hypothetical protein n=1 Tax=Variovorax soli TaxID=376815 RepID=UPI0008392A9D|nr:hypothetical protein [Variovorax soli]